LGRDELPRFGHLDIDEPPSIPGFLFCGTEAKEACVSFWVFHGADFPETVKFANPSMIEW